MPNYYEELKKICIKANPNTDITLADVLYAVSKKNVPIKLDIERDCLRIETVDDVCYFDFTETVKDQSEECLLSLVKLLS